MPTSTTNWVELLHLFFVIGRTSSPQGKETLELIGRQTRVDMKDPIILAKERNISFNFMFAEAWWILTGKNDVESIAPYAPSMSRFSDDGVTFSGAYGPEVVSQTKYAVNALREDPDSRQAVIEIWKRNPSKSKDIPCTLSLQFLIREGALRCVATMRSSDVWIGYIYDTFTFSAIAAYIALELKASDSRFSDLKLGTLTLTAGSQHLYSSNFEKALAIRDAHKSGNGSFEVSPFNLGRFVQQSSNGSDLIRLLEQAKDGVY